MPIYKDVFFIEHQSDVPLGTQTTACIDMGRAALHHSGLIGTDLLSSKILTFDYAQSQLYLACPHDFCTAKELTGVGFHAAATLSYYGTLDSRHVDQRFDMNVPTLAVRIAGVPGIAQLDSAYGDT